MSTVPSEKRLQHLRKKAGLTQPKLADLAETSTQQISRLENGERKLTKEWAIKLAPHLGVAWADVMGWDGVQAGINFQAKSAPVPKASSERTLSVPEYDVVPQAGPGGEMPEMDGDGRHPVVAEWSMPPEYLRAFVTEPSALCIVRVAGDSMEPDYPAGERVMVDTSHRIPSPPGVYVLWDGFGLVLKRVEIILGSDPPRIRLSSVNAAGYPAYERDLDEVKINGRVVGKWTWR